MTATMDLGLVKSLVQKQSCFSQLTPKEIDELATLFIEKRIPAGATIVTEADPVDSVYLIVSGTADVRHITIENGKTHVQSLATLNAGDAIGLNETGFYSLSGMRTATVVANTEMVVLRLSVAAFHGFALINTHVTEVMRKNAENLE